MDDILLIKIDSMITFMISRLIWKGETDLKMKILELSNFWEEKKLSNR